MGIALDQNLAARLRRSTLDSGGGNSTAVDDDDDVSSFTLLLITSLFTSTACNTVAGEFLVCFCEIGDKENACT